MPRFALSPRDLQRLLKRMGLPTQAEEVKAERVVIELEDGRRLVAEAPQVLVLRLPTGVFINVMASELAEEAGGGEAAETSIEVSEEDVRIVAEQAGVSPEEARKALIEAKGDIAEAILRLMEKKQGG